MDIRNIIKKYLVISERGPLILSENKKDALKVNKMAKDKNIISKIREVFLSKELMEALGRNLFKIKYDTNGVSIIEFRNKIIGEYQSMMDDSSSEELTWKKIAHKYNIGQTLEEFNQWCLDQMEYGVMP